MAVPQESLRRVRAQIEETWTEKMSGLIALGSEIVERDSLAATPVGKTVLTYSLGTAMMLRPMLRDPVVSQGLFGTIEGGTDYNPHYTIDLLPGTIGMIVWRGSALRDRVKLWNEETGFQKFSRKKEGLIVFTDPLDGSSTAELGLLDQVTGVVVYNRNGAFVAGAITSLVHNTIMFIEIDFLDVQTSLINFNETQGIATKFHAEDRKRDRDKIRYQTLPRRLYTLQNSQLFQQFGYPELPTLGGFGILRMAEGRQDIMVDPKGQPTPEAIIWYTMASEYGFPVTDLSGRAYELPDIVANFVRTKKEDRFPVFISRTPEIHRRGLPLVNQAVVEPVIFQN